ncbi:MAG TPA: M14 family metallopeptidase [Rhizomicrobium sp.]|nr:M14 family metallopeptidase [Rhizomicrobium sp.]
MTAARHFPSDYRQARANFIEAAKAAGLGVTTRMHPGATGPDGKQLFLDTATIGPLDAKSALLLVSATHGVEGYFGSGSQTGLLREGLASRIPPGTKAVILHALNPYGFSWNRRVNEDNADINRNFVDHTNPPANDAYDLLADAIAPKDISHDAIHAANAKLRAYQDQHGSFALQTAISSGQYKHADGLYFGGSRESWSAAMLKDVFREELAGIERLTAIDFHTGLGEHGAAEMITEDLPGTPAYARAKNLWGDLVHSSEAGESLSAPLTGTLDAAVAEWMNGHELTFAALEVGTRPMRDVLAALRKDNWLHAHSDMNDAQAPAIKAAIRDGFYPDTDEWKEKVWNHAVKAVDAAIRALA